MNKRKLYFWIHDTKKHDNCHYCGEPGVITYVDLDGDTISLCEQCDDKKVRETQ
jgi:hypothetical protein